MATTPAPQSTRSVPGWMLPVALLTIVLAGYLVYSRSFTGPALFDDLGSITENPTIRHISTSFQPLSSGWPVSGRPILNFSFALNYAFSGLKTTSYHVTNLGIHLGAALLLLGVIRRTLRLLAFSEGEALGLAWASTLLWTLHPIQTESVTYLSQRAESLMGFWYLLTVYCFIRAYTGAVGAARLGWIVSSVAATLLGVATKEVTCTVPLVLFIYDRLFLAKGWAAAWRARRGHYLALGATWILLAFLIAGTGSRGGTVGFHAGISWWAYTITQIRAIGLYLRLSLWPWPLRFTYGQVLGGPPVPMIISAATIVALVGLSLRGAWKGSAWAFLGIWFFGILAPTSSFVPVSTELIAEHRAYLSLAAVTTLAVVGGYLLLRQMASSSGSRWPAILGVVLAVGLAGSAGGATFVRNRVFSGVTALWADVVEKAPVDPGARNNYGISLCDDGRIAESLEQFQIAIAIAPTYPSAHHNLGNALLKLGRPADAVPEYESALAGSPHNAAILYQLGEAQRRLGHTAEAMRAFEAAMQGSTVSSEIWYELGNAFLDVGRNGEAMTAYERSLAIKPDYPDALLNHAGLLVQAGHTDQAIAEFEAVLRMQPDAADVHNNLGSLLAQNGRLAEAKAQFEAALRLAPNYPQAADNLQRVNQMLAEKAGR